MGMKWCVQAFQQNSVKIKRLCLLTQYILNPDIENSGSLDSEEGEVVCITT